VFWDAGLFQPDLEISAGATESSLHESAVIVSANHQGIFQDLFHPT
jgi:hypothetical protein